MHKINWLFNMDDSEKLTESEKKEIINLMNKIIIKDEQKRRDYYKKSK